jgi:hypothetical protein
MPMPDYRLYVLDGRDHIHSSTVLSAATDEEAIARAMLNTPKQRFELWCGARAVHRFEPLRD